MRILVSERAEEDLARIYAWLQNHYDIDAAERFRIRAEKALLQIGQHPSLGPHPGWATRHKLLRFWIINKSSYIVYYEPKGEEISIERVLDGRRNVQRIIELGIEDRPDE